MSNLFRQVFHVWFLGALVSGALAAAVEKPSNPVVFVKKAELAGIYDLLSYPARLVPKVNATLLADAEAVVQSIKAPLGTPVRKRQEVMRLRHTDPVFQYAPMRIVAPVSGVVSSVEVTEGSRVTKGQKLASIMDPSTVRIILEIAATDLQLVRPGLKGQLKVSSKENDVEVKVLGISPYVDPATGTATCELVFADSQKNPKLPPGLVGRVHFQVNAHQGIEVPDDSVVYRGKNTFLRLVNDNKAKVTPVVLGPTRRGQVEVVKGLEAGSTVIVRSSKYIADGESVTVENLEKDAR